MKVRPYGIGNACQLQRQFTEFFECAVVASAVIVLMLRAFRAAWRPRFA